MSTPFEQTDRPAAGTPAPAGSAYSWAEWRRDVKSDLRACGGGTWNGGWCTALWSVAFQLLFSYRLARRFSAGKMKVLCLPLKRFQYALCGSEISPQAVLGRGLHLPHPTGIVIGAGVVIEDDAWIFQQVTVGSHGRAGETLVYPSVGRGARIYAGAKVVGAVRVGPEAVVGANSVVLRDVPAGATVVGAPARVVQP